MPYQELVERPYQDGLTLVATKSPQLLYHQPPPLVTAQLFAPVSRSTFSDVNFIPSCGTVRNG